MGEVCFSQKKKKKFDGPSKNGNLCNISMQNLTACELGFLTARQKITSLTKSRQNFTCLCLIECCVSRWRASVARAGAERSERAVHHPWELAMAVRPCGSVHLRDATFLAKTTSYRLHRDRNEALRQEPAKQANSNKTDYFRIKQRNLSVARLEGREEAVGNERCGNCSGTGKCDCTYCGGIGRANYTDTNVLPAGQYPVWCKVST